MPGEERSLSLHGKQFCIMIEGEGQKQRDQKLVNYKKKRLEGTLDRDALDQGSSTFCVQDKMSVFLKSKNVMLFSIV